MLKSDADSAEGLEESGRFQIVEHLDKIVSEDNLERAVIEYRPAQFGNFPVIGNTN